jgi:ribose/xylose/arabinose/galactoside ABC-type transport system permease subunit
MSVFFTNWRAASRALLKKHMIAIAFLLICGVLSLLSENFLTWRNLLNILRQSSIMA